MKKPTEWNIGLDTDQLVIDRWHPERPCPLDVMLANAVEWLQAAAAGLDRQWVVYADPPYLLGVRSDKRPIYRNEFSCPKQHARLIEVLRSLRCHVLLSGYASPLYAELLQDWRNYSFQTSTRGGPRIETVWMNFDVGEHELHDTRFVGSGYRERERINRKNRRWERLRAMPPAERQTIRQALLEAESTGRVLPPPRASIGSRRSADTATGDAAGSS